MKRPRINLQIQAKEVRVVDEDRRDLGVFAISDALKMVAPRREDLIEIEPESAPPVCQFIDYGKFRYRQLQDEKKRRGLQVQQSRKRCTECGSVTSVSSLAARLKSRSRREEA